MIKTLKELRMIRVEKYIYSYTNRNVGELDERRLMQDSWDFLNFGGIKNQ